MTQNDAEHRAFEKLGKQKGWDMRMHPLHLIYLDDHTDSMLEIFKAGFSAGSKNATNNQSVGKY